MDFRSTGGIFLRLDSSGNLNIFNTAGTSIAKFVGSAFSATLNRAVLADSTTRTTTTTANYVSTGLGVTFTPQSSGKAQVFATIPVSSDTSGDGVAIDAFFNTGSIPAANATVGADSAFGFNLRHTAAANNQFEVLTLNGSVTLTVGTTYSVYIGYRAITGGTASYNPSPTTSQITVIEI